MEHRYVVPVAETGWHIPGVGATVAFDWQYDAGRQRMLNLYQRGKDKQWDSVHRIAARRPGSGCPGPRRTARVTTISHGRTRSSCTANRARWCVRPRSSRPCPNSTASSTPRRRRWTRLGTSGPTRVMIEGVALAAFSMIRDFTGDPLGKAINAYVMQDEARHIAFGRLALKDAYAGSSERERAEREEFVVEASYLLRDRFLAREVWETLGYDADELQ